MDTLFAECAEKSWDFETFGRFVFVQGIKKKKNVINDFQIMKIVENMSAQDKLLNKKSKSPRISNHKQLSRYRNFLTKKN